jgi:UDPglucose 6-dehydrogenase
MKSTVAPGTGDRIVGQIAQLMSELLGEEERAWGYASIPEFLAEGTELRDLCYPQRAPVCGAEELWELKAAEELVDEIRMDKKLQPILCSRTEAELVKLASNAHLAMRVAFANEVAWMSKQLGADAVQVLRGVRGDPRIGDQYLQEGPGFAGPCLPKDIRALWSMGEELLRGQELSKHPSPELLHATMLSNAKARNGLYATLEQEFMEIRARTDRGPIVAVWGLSFKPGCADIRTSLSVDVIQWLNAQEVAQIRLYDQHSGAMRAAMDIFERWETVICCESRYSALFDADVLLNLDGFDPIYDSEGTEGVEGLQRMKPGALIFDARDRISEPSVVLEAGLRYEGIGRTRRTP